eukprot:16708_5
MELFGRKQIAWTHMPSFATMTSSNNPMRRMAVKLSVLYPKNYRTTKEPNRTRRQRRAGEKNQSGPSLESSSSKIGPSRSGRLV